MKKANFLTTQEAESAVSEILSHRQDRLEPLRSHFKEKYEGKRILVLCPSPDANIPDSNIFDLIMTVNGACGLIDRTMHTIDSAVLVGYSSSLRNEKAIDTMRQFQAGYADRLLFIDVGDTVDHALMVLKDHDFSFRHLDVIDTVTRAAIIFEVSGHSLGLGKMNDRVSNGLFAAMLVLWAGGLPILSGFSLDGGHFFTRQDTPRHHLLGDRRALQILASRLRTVSSPLAAEFGIDIVGT